MTDKTEDQYRDTVFLPKTDFPMRAGLPQKEPEIVKKWADMDLYNRVREASKGKKKWVLHWGPPYANGRAHIGHAMTKTLKDVVTRSWQMMGYDAPLVPGWDCHGLPIEWKIEEQYREKGQDKDSVHILTFRQECRDFAMKWVGVQTDDFLRLGVLGNFKKPYLTMTNKAEADIVREIHKFTLNGGLYKGAKPVMWSVVEKTALAEAEVEYKEHKSVTVWIRFPVQKTNIAALSGADIVIWTTTPWTLPSNRAIGFGDAIEYGVYEVKSVGEGAKVEQGAKIVLAKSLAEGVKTQAKIEDWQELGAFKGADLAGTVASHPLSAEGYDFDVPLLSGDFVTDDAGTGFVHIAPGHGEDDFYLGVANNIEITDNVTDDGKFRGHVPLFAGLEIYTQKGEMGQGNFAVIKAMDEAGKLLSKGSLKHEYPHSWRSKAPVIFRTTPQWFIAMDNEIGLRGTALDAIKNTKWVPAKGEARITAMVAGRPDWCISRQRAWGVPIALFVNKNTGDILKDEAVLKRIGDTFEAEGSDAWWARDAQYFLGDHYQAEDFDQVFDIVDVWFESGCTHAFVVEDKQTWPEFEGVDQADLYLEGSDQHRGWFQSSLLESCGTRGRAPFKTVLTHGFVLDEKGYKMSKSLGNVIDPHKMMEEYGADILRLWTMTSNYADDIRIGTDTLKNVGDLYRRIRNTLRFLLGALDGFTLDESVFKNDGSPEPEEGVAFNDLPELERLVLHQLYEMDQKIRSHIENYDFGKLAKLLHDFCNEDLSAFYFDIRKDRLYCDAPGSFERRACRTVMAAIYFALTAWLAPILCFTAEEAWSQRPEGVFGNQESVHLREFPSMPSAWKNDALAAKWDTVKTVRKKVLEAIEPLRAEKTIASSLEARPVIALSTEEAGALDGLDLAEICITAPLKTVAGEPSVIIEKAPGGKCQRCWKVLEDVSTDTGLCPRCDAAVEQVKKAA